MQNQFQSTINVHILHAPKPEHFEHLKSLLDNQHGRPFAVTTGDDIPENTEILVAGRPTREQLTPLKDLKAVLIPFAGIPDVTRDVMREFPHVSLHNLHHNAPMTAEVAIALLFAAARTILPADRAFRQQDWTPRYEAHRAPYRGVILDGKTVLILGYGEIGRRVAAVCRAAGMRVIATKRTPMPDASDGVHPSHEVHPPDALPALLPQAHVLVICLPATPETDGLIGAEEIAMLPADAIIVNVGRGAVIDQQALFEALKSGKLHSAGLDVWYNYPTDEASRKDTAPADYPFHALDNVVMSPHRAGGGGIDEVEYRRMAGIADSLNRYTAQIDISDDRVTVSMPHKVDLDAGY